jgi:hypothetical protein
MAYDIGNFGASLDAAMTAIDYAGLPARKAKAKSEGKLRDRAVEGGRQSGGRRRLVGIRGGPRQSGRHYRGPDRIAQPQRRLHRSAVTYGWT